ncbi:oxidoreductase [Penicillium brevicompactum]|uniref:Oxidoreductase n=1 Tax=Penicillium brevicompactum TaxID=5074 RepID=A0A9W9Q4E7_PENBR|nr:oxidoreductase [Penicillium brevicompactum]
MTRETIAPVAQLKTISLKALKGGCVEEVSKLLAAAQQEGVFYLDVADDILLEDVVYDIGQLSRSLFAMSEPEKMKFDVDKLGPYKLNGQSVVTSEASKVSVTVSRATRRRRVDLFGALRSPVIVEYQQRVAEFQSICLDLAKVLFETLSVACQLPEESSFQSCHSASPLNLVRLLRYPGAMGDQNFSIPQTAHTDMGSLTFLFTDYPGLQIHPTGSSEWLHVMPRTGTPIVNLGDAMKILSNGKLESVLHRVVTVPGVRAEDRYSFAYLMRPEPSTLMAPLPGMGHASGGPVRTCEEWVSMKFRALRA